ncbi:MAG TPA: anthranilate synthase component I family protein [Pyrinomonadaceae bacterium]|nr:anthranilate synthase component I family protein [Acidobacteriota bacterium]HQZ97767.1 anthranilate synthase component I family protein [Pyrinomonadaceae bacterium]
MSDLSTFLEKAKLANVVPVVETMPADLLTPLSVYLKLSAASRNSFLLESVEGGKTLARYSFIGADPESVLRGNETSTFITTEDGDQYTDNGTIPFLKTHFSERHAAADPDLPSFIGGAIGFLGFACSEWFEPSLNRGDKRDDVRDDAAFMFFRSIVAFDHAKQVIKIISLVFPDEAGDDISLEALYGTARSNNQAIKQKLEHGELIIPPNTDSSTNNDITSNWKRADFESAVDKIKELIAAGECYQVVLSQCFTKQTNASPVAIYRAIRSLNPSPYMFLLKFEEQSIVGASPEMLVRCENERLEYRPIAGTRHRGKDAAEDEALAGEMRRDKKEVAEHLMLVDLGRNDLGRVAEYGSVKVDTLMNVEKYSHVQHLVSSLSAKLKSGLDRFDALAACFPAGTVSGAPKVRAIEIIRGLEPTARGVYSGAVGYFDYSGNMDTCIAIRTLVLENGVAKIQAGAGIVADSVPSLEFDETVNKAKVLLRALEIAESGTV